MKKLVLVSLAVATTLAISPVLLLGQSENFTVNINNNGIDFTGSGVISTLTAYPATPGGGTATDGYLITSFSGTLSVPGGPTGDAVHLFPSTNPGGNFQVGVLLADNLLFPANDVVGADSGFFDNSGILLIDSDGNYANIFTGSSIYVGPAGLPYWAVINDSNHTASTLTNLSSQDAGVAVPEYGALSMLILSALALAGSFFFKVRRSGLFLAA